MTRKMGLYIQRSNGDGVREMCQRIKPAVVLVHLDGGDLFGWLRANLPETFIVGRRYWTDQEQQQCLDSGMTGQGLAELVLGVPGAEHCHALMLFNEAMGSPVDHGGEPEFQRRAARLDRLQVEFRAALLAQGKEAVAFNFGFVSL